MRQQDTHERPVEENGVSQETVHVLVNGLIGIASTLTDSVSCPLLRADMEKVHSRLVCFRDGLQKVSEDTAPLTLSAISRSVRHDLKNDLSGALCFCELILDEEPAQLSEKELQELCGLKVSINNIARALSGE